MKTNVTMKDVAALANVSIATVSRYLNGKHNHLSSQTAIRVRNAIKQLNYIPDESARNLVTKKSNLIAVLVANVNDYFSTEIFKGVSSTLREKGYTAVLLDSNDKLETELDLLRSISAQNIFGGIILQTLNTNRKLLESSLNNIPTVMVDREVKDGIWGSVVTNNFESSKKACQFFKDSGLTNVIVLSNNINGITTREQRISGIKDVYGNNVKVINPGNTKESQNAAYQTIKTRLKNNPKTLIFALKEKWLLEYLPRLINDNILNDQSLTQITGFSDTNLAYAIFDKIRLIKQNPFIIGKNATDLLLDLIKNDSDNIAKKIIIPAEF